MKIPARHLVAAACLASIMPSAAMSKSNRQPAVANTVDLRAIKVDIPFKSFRLANGLTVVVHEDHSAPLVAVDVWYHTGAKDEPPGKSGFAHLFEHLMFNGSEHHNDDFYKATKPLGATDQNGSTNADRTNYFETVPTSSLDSILWLESDRMAHLLGAIDQKKLDEQRKVVQNEKREGENRPYSVASDLIVRAMYPKGHPYDHRVIGSMADLDAASLDDVKEWFRRYYGASNAVLVLAGDITLDQARAKAEKYFGSAPAGEPVAHVSSWPVPLSVDIRETAYDRVARPRLYKLWNIGSNDDPDTSYLDLLSTALAGDRTAPLTKRLVIDEQLATSVWAGVEESEIAGQFQIVVTAKRAADLPRIERIVNEELSRALRDGPDAKQLKLAQTGAVANFVRSTEKVASRAYLLAQATVLHGSPDGWKSGFERQRSASVDDVRQAANRWLKHGSYTLDILPFGTPQAGKDKADRSAMPTPGKAVAAQFPQVEQAMLSNGMKLVVARSGQAPVVDVSLLLRTGVADGVSMPAPGVAGLGASALKEGTATRDAAALTTDLSTLGASLDVSADTQHASVSLSALKATLAPALSIMADVVEHPAYPAAGVERLKQQALSGIASSQQDPASNARRVLDKLVYGADTPYGRLTTAADVKHIEPQQLAEWHARWFHPANATLIVTGDTTLAEIRPIVERAFSNWQGREAPAVSVPVQSGPTISRIYLQDKPGAGQTAIRAAVVIDPRTKGDEVARQIANDILGASFLSRINMSLREAKGWTYGAYSGIAGAMGTRILSVRTSIQTDRTADGMAEIARIIGAATAQEPLTQSELTTAKNSTLLSLGDAWSTADGIAGYLATQSAYNLPANYYATLPARLDALTLSQTQAALDSMFAGKPITWVIVGDRAKIEPAVRALKLAPVTLIDADGNVIEAPKPGTSR